MSVQTLRYLGLAKEESFNQDTPPAAAYHVDIASATLDTPADTELLYEGGLGRGIRTHRPGFYAPEGNIVYAFDIRTIGFLLYWALGGYLFTEVAEDHNNHEIYGANNILLPSFAARLGKDVFEHVFSGCTINSLEINVEGEFCQATADITAAKDAKASLQDIADLILPDEFPLAFHELTAKISKDNNNMDDISCDVKSFTLTIENNLDAEAGRGVGQRHPCRIIAGERSVTFSADLFYEDTSHLERYWGGSDGPTKDGSSEYQMELVFDSGDYGNMEISLPRAIYTQVQQQPSGRDEIVLDVEGNALVSTINLSDDTDVESEVLILLKNDEGDMDNND